MAGFDIASGFVRLARHVQNVGDLVEAISATCASMHIQYFALSHHVDFRREGNSAIRIHNYPPSWERWFDDHELGRLDPIHRASHLTNTGFAWTNLPLLMRLTPEDQLILDQAHRIGIGEGYTVPANVPGEMLGSCSFAVEPGRSFPEDLQLACEVIGAFAFEAARRLTQSRAMSFTQLPILTDRQRDCVLWAARGKTDWEIAKILGVSHETVIQHLKHARERYGVQKRAMLAVRALFDGVISFSDILKR